MRLPQDKVDYVLAADENEARIAVARLNDGEWPGFCILCNANASIGLLQAVEAAVRGKVVGSDGTEREITAEDREGWKGMGLTLAGALKGAMS